MIRKFVVVASASALFCLVLSASASATATTTKAEWYTGVNAMFQPTLTGSASVTMSINSHPGIGSTVRFQGFLPSGTFLQYTATGVQCVGCVIENKAVTGGPDPVATLTGQITFTGVTVTSPSPCTLSSSAGVAGHLTSTALAWHWDFMDGEKVLTQVRPVSGESMFTFKLAGSGCAVAGTYNVKGNWFIEGKNKTGVAATAQGLQASAAINEAAGGKLAIGSNALDITGSVSLASGGWYISLH